ncbi:MAG: isocitrate/isopropylmalate family dehydrogenase, partial [Candidatus Thermoplasmatota archaeon]
TAMSISVKLMLDWLGEKEDAEKLEKAIAEVIKEGKIKTYDLGGNNTTLEVAEEIAKKYKKQKI